MEGIVKKKEEYFAASTSNPVKLASNGYNSNSKLDLGKKKIQLKTCSKKLNNTNDVVVPVSSGVDFDSARGRFGWAQVMETHLPFIFRGEEEFFCYRILEQKVLAKLYFHFYKELVACTNAEFFKITEVEAALFNEINAEHSNFAYGKERFTSEDVLIKTSYVGILCGFLHSCYKKMENPNEVGISKRCGFVLISKDAAVPYAFWKKQRYLPVFYFEGETSDLEPQSLRLEGLPLAFLKFCCRIQGIRKDLIDEQWCKVIALKDLTNFFAPNTMFKEFWPARTDICRSLKKVDSKKVYTLESIFNMKLNILGGDGKHQGKNTVVVASKSPPLPAKRPATSTLPKMTKLPSLLPRYRVVTEAVASGHNMDNGHDTQQGQNMGLNRDKQLTGQNSMLQGQEKQLPGQNFKLQGQEKPLPGQNFKLQCQEKPLPGQNFKLQGQEKPLPGQNFKLQGQEKQLPGQNMLLGKQPTGQNMLLRRDTLTGHNLLLDRDKQTSKPFAAYKIQYVVIEEKPIICINMKLNDFTEKLVTIIDLSNDFFYKIPVNVCEQIFHLLNIEIYKANDAQLTLLRATGKYWAYTEISLVHVDKVKMYLTQLTYMIRHIIEKSNENSQNNQAT